MPTAHTHAMPLALAVAACLLTPRPASAAPAFMAVTVDGTNPNAYFEANATTTGNTPSVPTAADFTGTLGWEFSPTQNVTVTSLGYFDDMGTALGGQSLSMNHDVGLYDTAGDLLASATITTASPASGLFRFADLATPVGLTAGADYILGGVAGTDGYAYDLQNASPFAPGITYLQDAYDPGNAASLTFPTATDGSLSDPNSNASLSGNGYTYFGPNFQYIEGLPATPPAVPEPSPLALIGLGLVPLALRARRRA